MKIGDMTIKQIAEICAHKKCNQCPFYECTDDSDCILLNHFPSFQDLDMEVNTDAEDQS